MCFLFLGDVSGERLSSFVYMPFHVPIRYASYMITLYYAGQFHSLYYVLPRLTSSRLRYDPQHNLTASARHEHGVNFLTP